ncbi:MAG: hypothetical protein AAGC60_15135 [Acidobacteriota bacterium]
MRNRLDGASAKLGIAPLDLLDPGVLTSVLRRLVDETQQKSSREVCAFILGESESLIFESPDCVRHRSTVSSRL